jgi:hypothetical protein
MNDELDEARFMTAATAFFSETAEWVAEIEKARQCGDPDVREQAVAHLQEENVMRFAKLADQILAAAEAGVIELGDEGRAAALECIELGVTRPDWYGPGTRVVLPDEEQP